MKNGVPGLRDKAQRLLSATHPGDQVLFGVDSPEDYAECEAACATARARLDARVIRCRPGALLNPKIAKLVELAPHCVHEHWIISDSEALLDGSFLDEFREEWRDSGAAALTAGYRISGARSWPQRLDRLPVALTLWPGLAVVEWLSRRANRGLAFTLGACTGVRRNDVESAGGWHSLGSYLAEDNRLGAALAAAGRRVRLARAVITLEADPFVDGFGGWLQWVLHQHRVAVTYRVCSPRGAFGIALTHGLPWSLWLALANGRTFPWCWGLFGLVALTRIATARSNAYRLGFSPPENGVLPVLLSSLAEPWFWLSAWLPLPVRWANRSFRVNRQGLIARRGVKKYSRRDAGAQRFPQNIPPLRLRASAR